MLEIINRWVSLLEERRLRLVRLISPEPGAAGLDLQIKAMSEPGINHEPITDTEDRLNLAYKSRPDLNEARLKLKQKNLETIMTSNGLLPRLDFFAALGNNGFGDSFFDSVQDTGSNNFDMKAGLRFSRFFSSRTAKARDIAARSSRDQAALAVENLQQMIALDVRLAINEVERTRQQIEASGKTRKFQEQTLYAEKQRFEVGTSTALLLAQAQRDLLASRINEVEAVINFRIAQIRLFRAEGSLLERRGIRIND